MRSSLFYIGISLSQKQPVQEAKSLDFFVLFLIFRNVGLWYSSLNTLGGKKSSSTNTRWKGGKKGTATVNQIATPQLQHQSIQTIVNSHPQIFSLAISPVLHSSLPNCRRILAAHATPLLVWTLTPNSNFSFPAVSTWPTLAPCINPSTHGALHSGGIKKIQVPYLVDIAKFTLQFNNHCSCLYFPEALK